MPRKKVITGRRSSLQSSIWNFPDQVPGMSNVIQPLGQVHIYGAYLGHILLALFFKTLSLAIGQKTVLEASRHGPNNLRINLMFLFPTSGISFQNLVNVNSG